MSAPNEDEPRGPDRGKKCPECGAARAPDQRYCLACGARLGSLPGAIAAQIARVRQFATGRIPVVKATVPAAKENNEGKKGWPFERSEFMPSPRAAAVAVIAMLGLGVLLGSATNQLAQSAGITSILLEEPQPAAEEEEATPEPVAAAPEVEAGGSEAPVLESVPSLVPEEAPLVEEPLGGESEEEETFKEPVPPGLPEIKHVFVIMLGENSYEETFGETSTSEYLSKELPEKGELIPNFYAVTKGELANGIALLTGQGPTPETQLNCPNYTDIAPGTESAEGQVEGNGCVYPATTKTLPGQLEEKKLTWKAYVEGAEDGAAVGQPTSCRHPTLGGPDPNQAFNPSDGYVTWRNPFVYFHSILDGEECAKADVGLPDLSKDLQSDAEDFPSFAYIAPGICHRGSEAPCQEGEATGPAASEEFLKAVVPEILGSFAYKDGGLVVITSAQARQGGEKPDTSACCLFPEYPNLPPEPEPETGLVRLKGGGGKVGAVLLSPYVEPGTTTETAFNHFSLLVSIEEFFGLEKIGYSADPLLVGFDESMFAGTG